MSVLEQAPDWITFMTGSDWGRTFKHSAGMEILNDKETYVHHTAGGQKLTDNPVIKMRELQSIDQSRGYATVQYDVVCHMGATGIFTVMEGRGRYMSAATKDRNEEGEAICLMGYFHPGSVHSRAPLPREIEGLAWGIAWMIDNGWSSRDTTVLGHRDNPRHPGATACPGDFLWAELPTVRAYLFDILYPLYPTPDPTPPTEEDIMLIGYVKHPSSPAIYRQWSNGTKTWVPDPDTLAVHQFIDGPVTINTMPNDAWMQAAGVIVGPHPANVDGWGIPIQ